MATSCRWWILRGRLDTRLSPNAHAVSLHIDVDFPGAMKVGSTSDFLRESVRAVGRVGPSAEFQHVHSCQAFDLDSTLGRYQRYKICFEDCTGQISRCRGTFAGEGRLGQEALTSCLPGCSLYIRGRSNPAKHVLRARGSSGLCYSAPYKRVGRRSRSIKRAVYVRPDPNPWHRCGQIKMRRDVCNVFRNESEIFRWAIWDLM
jgi:hypothetical protein